MRVKAPDRKFGRMKKIRTQGGEACNWLTS
jgi:hypothetical protein